MSTKNWIKSLDTSIQVAVITGIAAILAAGVTGLLALLTTSVGGLKVLPSPSSTTSSAKQGCTTQLQITTPTDGVKVSGPSGVLVQGQACGLSNQNGWLFDYDFGDGYYHEDYAHSPGPIVVENGQWAFLDRPIGSKGDNGKPYLITLILANQKCNSELQSIKSVDVDYRVSKFPDDCRIVAKRSVDSSWPER